MPSQEKWEEKQWSIVARLLDQIIPHLEGTDCTLIADRGIAGFPLVKICRDRNWHYLLRVSKEHTCQRKMGKGWRRGAVLMSLCIKRDSNGMVGQKSGKRTRLKRM